MGEHERRPPAAAVPWRLVLLVGLLLVALAAAVTADLPTVPETRAYVESTGPFAPLVFVLLYATVTLAPLPKNLLSAVAGLVFGLGLGSLLTYLAAMIGAVVAFVLGRRLGRSAVERYTGTRVAEVDARVERHGLVTVLLLRLVPVVPFTAINYTAGLTRLRRRDYLLGTAVGIVPGTVAYVALGSYGTSPLSWPFVTAAGALAALAVGGAVVARRGRLRPGER